MAGGTSRTNHSEVGSSYIHFNFTPQQDKATPSMLGDVPHGVMLGESPIFLGGQGGIVGPAKIGFGTVAAAGTILRQDCEEGGKIISSGVMAYEKDFVPGCYGNVSRRVLNNIIFMANILALREWYRHVRQPVFRVRHMGDLWTGAMDTIDCILHERINRFRAFAQKMDYSVRKSSLDLHRQIQFHERWPDMEAAFTGGEEKSFGAKQRESFLKALGIMNKKEIPDYISLIQGLDKKTAAIGTAWLQAIVDGITDRAVRYVPLCKPSRP
jgi:UDP-N-acetylglucosamine/UDP-N-acetylgalactosamine diphosphorylase